MILFLVGTFCELREYILGVNINADRATDVHGIFLSYHEYRREKKDSQIEAEGQV